MGVKCSCLTEISREENSLRFENSREMIQDQAKKEIDINDIIKLQGVIRGYADRKKAKVLYTNYRNIKSRVYRKIPNPDISLPPELIVLSQIPSYTNPIVQTTFRKLGPFRHQNVNDKIERLSKGPILLKNQAVYIGEWNLLDQRDGYGMQIWPDGSVYEGYWKNNTLFKGRLIYENGDAYDGEWYDNKANGKGICYYNDGSVYTGDWVSDRRHGIGVEIAVEGLSYKGEFHQDKKHGKGVLSFDEGSEYQGDFYNDQMHGFGRVLGC